MEFAPQHPNVQDVKVKLLLAGGHQYTLYLKLDSPILHSLMTTLVSRAQKQGTVFSYLFQIPIEEGRAVVSFPSEHWFRTPFRKVRYQLRQCPVYFYTDSSIRELCETAGFTDVRIQKIPGAGMDFHVSLKP